MIFPTLFTIKNPPSLMLQEPDWHIGLMR